MPGSLAADGRSSFVRLGRDPWVWAGVAALVLALAIPLAPWLEPSLREFFNDYLSTILWLALTVVALAGGVRRFESPRERSFWRLLAVALMAWLAAEILQATDLIAPGEPTHGVAIDAFYLLYYLGTMLALDVRPHAAAGSGRTRFIRHVARAGRTLFVIGLFGYFVVLPRTLMPAAYLTWIPSYAFYLALDVYLVGRLVYTAAVSPDGPWRVVYVLMSIAMASVLATDVLDMGWMAGRWVLPSPGPVDVLYFLPFASLLAANRLRHATGPADAAAALEADPDRVRGVPLVAYSLSLPVIHLLLDLFRPDPPRLRAAHTVLVLAGLLVLGGLNLVQNALIERWAREHRKKREEAEAQSRFLARHDPLTGLLNRRELERELSRAIARADRTGRKVGVMFVDLDRFKEVNDLYGHQAGDAVLQEVARRVRDCIRDVDVLSRYGGDEFVLVLEALERRNDADLVASRILQRLAGRFHFQDEYLEVAASIGISVSPDDGRTNASLLDAADRAMYAVKAAGGAGARFAEG